MVVEREREIQQEHQRARVKRLQKKPMGLGLAMALIARQTCPESYRCGEQVIPCFIRVWFLG